MLELNLAYLAILYGFVLLSYFYVARSGTKNRTVPFILLLVVGILVTAFVRIAVYPDAILATTDEANYIAKLLECSYTDCIASGPGYLAIVDLFSMYFPDSPEVGLILFASILSSLYLPLLFLFYDKVFDNISLAYLTAAALLFSNYFVYPIIMARPQQLGMLLLPFLAYFVYFLYGKMKILERWGLLFALLLIIFYLHIITFFVALLLTVAILTYKWLKDDGHIGDLFYTGALGLLYLSMFSFGLFEYEKQSNGVISAFSQSSSEIFTGIAAAYPYSLLATYVLLFVGYCLILTLIKERQPWFTAALTLIQKKSGLYLYMILGYVFFFAMFVQFVIRDETYTTVYGGSTTLFFIFQLGNILFGLAYLYVLMHEPFSEKRSETSAFLRVCSFAFLITGVLSIAGSFFMADNFSNWIVRVVQYMLPFAVAYVTWYFAEHLLKKKWLVALILVLMLPGIMLGSRDPEIFDNKVSWTDEDITAMTWLTTVSVQGEEYVVLLDEELTNVDSSYKKLYRYLSYLLEGAEESITFLADASDAEGKDKLYDSTNLEVYN